jgi:hypothetical protein
MVYPGPRSSLFQSEKSSSREEVLRRLHAAIPGFDEGPLLADSAGAQIVLAETMQLTDEQILTFRLD